MPLYVYRGRRIRPWMEKMNSLLATSFSLVLLIPVGVYAYINRQSLQSGDIKQILTVVVASLLAIFLGLGLFWLFHEQTVLGAMCDRLRIAARMLFEHGFFYEKKTSQQNSKKKIRFPKVYMKQSKHSLEIAFEMGGNKFQEKFKKMGGDLETSFFMDCTEVTDDPRYKTYTLAYSAFLNRINVSDVAFAKGKGLKLMKNLYWDWTSDPHCLIAGGTGGGKTVLLRSLILGLAKIGVVDICDPKHADFVTMADLKAFKDRVVFDVEAIVEKFEEAHATMENRYTEMNNKRIELGHKDLKSFDAYGMQPYFLVCDEFNALMSVVNAPRLGLSSRFDTALTQIVLKGRQAGVYLILAMQKPSRDDLSSKMQANMNMRLSVGRLDEFGYDVMFGEVNRNKDFKYLKKLLGKRIYGRGYAAVNGEVAREWFSPNMPKNFNFFDAYETLERIDNPYSPKENPAMPWARVVKEEVSQFAPQSHLSERLSVVSPKQSKTKSSEEKETLSLTEMVKLLNTTSSRLIRVQQFVEETGKVSFAKDEQGKTMFSQPDKVLLEELYALKASTNQPWSKIIKDYFASLEG